MDDEQTTAKESEQKDPSPFHPISIFLKIRPYVNASDGSTIMLTPVNIERSMQIDLRKGLELTSRAGESLKQDIIDELVMAVAGDLSLHLAASMSGLEL